MRGQKLSTRQRCSTFDNSDEDDRELRQLLKDQLYTRRAAPDQIQQAIEDSKVEEEKVSIKRKTHTSTFNYIKEEEKCSSDK